MQPARTQEEIDHYWDKLTRDGGEEVQCGWLTDAPDSPGRRCRSSREWTRDAEGFSRVMQAIMPMKKLDLAALQAAFEGKRSSARSWRDGPP